MESFWSRLPKPFFALAPLEDVTDAAFRRLIAKYGKPDVMFTEFTSADGLSHICGDIFGVTNSKYLGLGKSVYSHKLGKKLLYSEGERPIVAQIFSSIPENIEKAAVLALELGFDGVDINMGCPDRAVEKGGCGAALIKNPPRARELIVAAKKSGLPVSVKTRIGYSKDELDTWLPELLAEGPAAVTLHARTRKEMSDVPAHWDRITRAVQIRNAMKSESLIIGNGDADGIAHARDLAAQTGCDGIMLGRAIFGNPWLFATYRDLRNPDIVRSPQERIRALVEHLKLFEELLADTTPYATMKKHFKAYVSGWDGAKELRSRLMESSSPEDARRLLASAIVSS